MTCQPLLASYARHSCTVRAVRAPARQVDCSFLFVLGCNTILSAMSIHLMLRHARNRGSFSRPIFIINVLLYLSCTPHFALEFGHFYKVLVRTTP